MPTIREVSEPVTVLRQKQLVRIVWSGDGISAVWDVPAGLDGSGRAQVTVEVSEPVASALLARAGWTTAVDAVASDTQSRAVAP